MRSTLVLDLKDSHNESLWKTLNINIISVCLHEKSTGHF